MCVCRCVWGHQGGASCNPLCVCMTIGPPSKGTTEDPPTHTHTRHTQAGKTKPNCRLAERDAESCCLNRVCAVCVCGVSLKGLPNDDGGRHCAAAELDRVQRRTEGQGSPPTFNLPTNTVTFSQTHTHVRAHTHSVRHIHTLQCVSSQTHTHTQPQDRQTQPHTSPT